MTNTRFTKLPNTFELFGTLDSLSKISCEPNGMAWSTDNTTLYFSDGHTANITKCVYDMYKADASDCSTILSIKEVLGETAVPQGLATDENGHVWVAVAKVDGKGAVLEIEPDSADIISTIGLEVLEFLHSYFFLQIWRMRILLILFLEEKIWTFYIFYPSLTFINLQVKQQSSIN